MTSGDGVGVTVERVELSDLGGWPGVLRRLYARDHLRRAEAQAVMAAVLGGTATPAQIAGFIVALRMKGETVDELNGLLDAMLAEASLVELDLDAAPVIDIVGSGGDGSQSINVSTLAAIVVAGAGGRVCKHGNRAASSRSGAADVLEQLGVALEVDPDVVARCVGDAGVGFCFAPRFHPAMRHAGPPRRELGVPTVFNYLGPIANPARVRRLVLGVGDPAMARPMAEVLAARGAERVLVVHGDDGMDELTTTACSTVLELAGGELRQWALDPASLGLARSTREDLIVTGPEDAALAAKRVLGGEQGPQRDIVLLNAAAGLLVAGVVEDLVEGLERAAAAVDDGAAAVALERLAATSQPG
ncbi:MAG: anthranilate phosphoribosyltransferase [Acidimicrobiia bacterium]|nr:anthranilate phosphoribosyltransferase [Acidimicrobiia bacterium]